MITSKNIIIVGYPKSGNTWATRLVAELIKCPVAGFLDEPDNKDIVIEGAERKSLYAAFKAHHTIDKLVKSPTAIHKVICIVRDPRDIAVSGAHFFKKLNTFRSETILDNFDAMVETLCHGSSYAAWCNTAWSQHVTGYLSNYSDLLIIIRYEDLIADGLKQLRRIAAFLNVDRTDTEIQECINKQHFEVIKKNAFEKGDLKNFDFLREGKSEQYRQALTVAQIRRIELSCSNEMIKLGYTISNH